jgi:hypothetical protein
MQTATTETEIFVFSAAVKLPCGHLTPKFDSDLVRDYFRSLTKFGSCNQVQLEWVPEQKGIPSNEKADFVVRKVSTTPFQLSEPAMGTWQKGPGRRENTWKSASKMGHAKMLIVELSLSVA